MSPEIPIKRVRSCQTRGPVRVCNSPVRGACFISAQEVTSCGGDGTALTLPQWLWVPWFQHSASGLLGCFSGAFPAGEVSSALFMASSLSPVLSWVALLWCSCWPLPNTVLSEESREDSSWQSEWCPGVTSEPHLKPCPSWEYLNCSYTLDSSALMYVLSGTLSPVLFSNSFGFHYGKEITLKISPSTKM